MSTFRSIVATNTGATIKNTGATVRSLNIINRHNAAIFVKFYDSDVASFQDIPIKVFQVAASSPYPSIPISIHSGWLFSTTNGLTVRVVTGSADDDNTAAATLPIIEVYYD